MRPILLNTSLHALLFLILVSLISIFRSSPHTRFTAYRPAIRFLQSRILLVFLIAGTLVNIGLRVTAGYINPRDYMQDYVAAKHVFERASLYPPNLPTIAAELADSRFVGRGTLEAVPIFRGEFATIRENAPGNAHPPLNAVLVAVPATILGVRGSYLFFWVFFSLCLMLIVKLILAEYAEPIPRRYFAGILAFLFGWYPVIASLRNAYSSILIALLCVACWHFLRRNQQALAGVCIGVATCLHFYPIFVAGYFFFRKRVAFLSFAASSVFLVGISTLFTYPSVYLEWIDTAKQISNVFVSVRGNSSITGSITFLLTRLDMPFNHTLITIIVGIAVFGFLIYSLELWRKPDGGPIRNDIEFSAFLVACLLVSPITWQNYFLVVLLPVAVLIVCERHNLTPQKTLFLLVIGVILSIPSLPIEEYVFAPLRRLLGIYPAWFLTSAPTLALLTLMGWLVAVARGSQHAVPEVAACLAAPDMSGAGGDADRAS